MAEITIEDVKKVAGLSKLSFSDKELTDFNEQFKKIIHFFEKISELDTENVQPTTHAVEKSNVTRVDEVGKSMDNDEISKVAPKFANGSILVPKVIDY